MRSPRKVTLQPNSQLDVQEYEASPGQESVVLELLKGAMRTITGQIGKRQPDKISVKARGVTVGIRGTTFAMRLCNLGQQDCQFRRGVSASGRIETNEPESSPVRILLRDRSFPLGSGRRQISRDEYRALMGDTYAWLIEGAIVVTSPRGIFDLEIDRGCLPEENPAFPLPSPTSPEPCGNSTTLDQPSGPGEPRETPNKPNDTKTQQKKKSPPKQSKR